MGVSGEEIRNYRLKKLADLRAAGVDPYPARASFALTTIGELAPDFKKLVRSRKSLGIAGRVMARREHGGSAFLNIFDGSAKFQVFVGKDRVGDKQFRMLSDTVDIGDFIAVWGHAFYTKRKEPTLEIAKWEMLAKSLLPLPEKWHGFSDIEERFRKRYLDLIMNKDVRNRFLARSRIIQEIRSFLDANGFLEVETPMLHLIPGGALAHPFRTHHNALDTNFYLRIAPELYLKRLIAGGFCKIYELGRTFRNEGIDHSHNPEFTMLELYAAYWSREDLLKLVERLIGVLVKNLFKKSVFVYQEQKIDVKKFRSVSFTDALERHAAITHYQQRTLDDMRASATRFGVIFEPYETKAKIADTIFKKIVRPKLIQPTFLMDHPIELSPLAKKNPSKPGSVDRFQLIMGGIEIVNGFSELNDPVDQKERFEAQEKLKEKGEQEVTSFDADYVEALEYGLPPTAGIGVGIDRLIMLLTDTRNIKEVILFPTLKPK